MPILIPATYVAIAPLYAPQNLFQSALSLPLTSAQLKQISEQTTLADALHVLAQEDRLQFVLEGTPARLPADKPSIAKVVTDLVAQQKPITTRELTLALAENYGYSVVEKADTRVFAKKYENPADFPELTTPEMKSFLRSVLFIVRNFNPETTRNQGIDIEIRDFANTLSPELLAQMKRIPHAAISATPTNAPKGPGGVPVSSLSPTQQQFFREVALKNFIGTDADQIARGPKLMGEFDSSESSFRHVKVGIQDCLTNVRIVSGSEYHTSFTPISRIDLDFGSASIYQNPLPNGDPDAPKPSDYGTDKKPLPWKEVGKYSVTLDTLATTVSEGSMVTLHIVPELAEKTVTLIDGRQGVKPDPKALAQIVSALYNIVPRATQDGKDITLGLPTRPTVLRLDQIPHAIETLMPGPVKRACEGWLVGGAAETIRRLPAQLKTVDGQLRPNPNRPNEKPVLGAPPQILFENGVHAMRRQASRQLSLRLEPMLAAKADHIVAWSELDAESKWLVQFMLCMQAFPHTYGYTQNGMPDYVSHFETDRAFAEIFENQGRTWLRVKLVSQDGRQGVTQQGIISKP